MEVNATPSDSAWLASALSLDPYMLIDARVAELYPAVHSAIPDGRKYYVTATEERKTLETVADIIDAFCVAGVTRKSCVIVVGGGITQDVGAMACGIYRRGVPWCYIPTTLLAMSDSAVGSKASLNRGTKNAIGLFAPPQHIIMATSFLTTLSEQCLLSGAGEVFKLAAIGGAGLLAEAQAAWDDRDLVRLIRIGLSVKIPVIEHDEFDRKERLALNYGHTFGHALEAATNFAIPHGIAVMYGMIIVNKLMTPGKHKAFNQFLLNTLGSGFNDQRVALSDVHRTVARDKKNSGGLITLIVLDEPGKCSLRQVQWDTLVPRLRELLGGMFVLH